METIGIYLHIPFCQSKCLYCDFCSFPHRDEATIQSYCDALCREIDHFSCEKLTADTIYFGGGTPSLLSLSQFSCILSHLCEKFSLTEDAEITIEANPKTADLEKLKALRSLGINRLSIGMQTSDETELKRLGRLHTFSDVETLVQNARQADFDNISLDLMYGIPEQTPASFKKSLNDALSLAPEHLSAYSLIVEEGTPFFRSREKLHLPSDDDCADFYETVNKIMKENGYLHYEISNYALQGKQCKHNLKYWHGEDFLGFGVSAYACFQGIRYGHSRDLSAYLRGDYTPVDAVKQDKKNEYIMLNLRLSHGISLPSYSKAFGEKFEIRYADILQKYVALGLAEIKDDRFFLTEKGMFVSNTILCDFLQE